MKVPNNIVSTRKRLLFLILAIAFLFVSLFVRLAYIQIIDGADLQIIATDQWYRDLPLNAQRGIIYDENQTVLVDNKDVYTIYVRPSAVTDKTAVAKILAQELEYDESVVLEKISQSVSEVTLAKTVSTEIADALKSYDMDGVYFTPDSERSYPNGASLSKVLGFTNVDLEGQNGLELYYDKYLTGTDGFVYTSTDLVGRETDTTITEYAPAIQGCSLTLSIDNEIQSFADYAVNVAKEEHNASSASMIVMDVTDGGIVAMSSSDGFDLNEPPRDDIDLLNALSKNNLITDVYEPGSTFKIFTTASAIESDIDTDNCCYFCNGYHMVDGEKIKCWRSIGHGSQNLADGVMNSCNVVFMNLALEMGTEYFYDSLHDFGFGSKTNIDFYGESSGIMMEESSVKNVDLARIGFGQAIAVTPLQLITAVSSVVNGGTLYEPYFVKEITSYDGTTIFTKKPTAVRQVISESTSAQMRELLESVVSQGSGKLAQVDGYAIGGKTGTAQKYENGVIASGKYISSFVGFAPANDPKYAILMLVDEPTGGAYYGSIVAAPYVGDVFSRIFDYENILPTEEVEEDVYITMPNFIGYTATEVTNALNKLGITFEIAGDSGVVESTLPVANDLVSQNGVVLIRLDDG